MPYGVPDELWRHMADDDKAAVKQEWDVEQTRRQQLEAAKAPISNGKASLQPTKLPVQNPAEVNWYYKRRLDQYPQDAPNYEQLRTLGFGGIMSEYGDPNLGAELQQDRQAGFLTGTWYPAPNGITAADACAQTVAAARAGPTDALGLDIEFPGKGYAPDHPNYDPNYQGWEWNKEYAACVRARLPNVPVSVNPMPLQDDFNYKAYTDVGGVVWVQCYGETAADVFDPVVVCERVHANGVPYNRIGALLLPTQLPTAVGPLQALGITQIAVFGTDGLTPEVVNATVPFPATGTSGTDLIEAPTGVTVPDSQAPDSEATAATPEAPLPPETLTEFLTAAELGDLETMPDLAAVAVEEQDIDLATWFIDTSLSVDEPAIRQETTRTLAGVTVANNRTFPSWCLRSVGGYTQGVSGPISTGLRQLELLIGVQHVHGDYATHGHAKTSFHYCGLAVDLDKTRDIWDYLFPVRQELLEFFGPWGLYDRGVKFHDANLQKAHLTHIHVALNKTADAVSALWPKNLAGRFHVPGGAHPAPLPIPQTKAVAPSLEQGWEELSKSLSTKIPASVNRVLAADVSLRDTLRKRKGGT